MKTKIEDVGVFDIIEREEPRKIFCDICGREVDKRYVRITSIRNYQRYVNICFNCMNEIVEKWKGLRK